MDKDFWHAKWQNKDIKFDQKNPNEFLLKYIKNLDLTSGSKIFVPLCGKSIDMLWFLKNDYQVIGVELNNEACRLFFSENDLLYREESIKNFKIFHTNNITLLSGDFFDLNKEIVGNFDAIYDRAALVALPKTMRAQYAKKLMKLSAINTKMLLITGVYDQNEMEGPPFSVDRKEIFDHYEQQFEIVELHNEPAEILPHLRERGLKKASNLVVKLKKLRTN